MAPVIDAHVHIWKALPAGVPGVLTIVSPHEDVPVERALNVMDQHGIERAVLVQPMFRGEDNDYVAAAARERPDRLATVCVVDPRLPGAADRLENWVVAFGCRGLRLRPRVPEESAAFGDPATFPLWERARSLGIVASVLASPEHLATIGALASRFPTVPLVVDHLGHPKLAEGIGGAGFQQLLALANHPSVSIKISGTYHFTDHPDPYAHCQPFIQAIYDRFGPERLLWGSDFPHVERTTGYARALECVRDDLPFLYGPDRELILGGNAAKLYWGSGAPSRHVP
jgi:predicted TIM-barrel fold metal-dependent hydrolase